MAWSKTLLQILLPIACLAFALRLFFVQSLVIETNRLAPVLLRGDFVVGIKASEAQRGDLVTFQCIERPTCVGRVLGLPGDRLDFREEGVLINQKILLKRLFSAAPQLNSPATVVPPDSYFVEGDDFGEVMAVQVGSVLSRVLISVDPHERKFRWRRIWKAIH